MTEDTMSELSNQHVLVTGGAGFIGSRLVHRLTPDIDVVVFDSLTTGTRDRLPESVSLVEGDIRDQEALEATVRDADVVFHQAALVSVGASVEDPSRSHDINVEGTLNVLEAARRHDARVVLASSAAIYGHPETIPVSETHSKEPTSPYGLDKLACDHYARLYHDLYELETVALRYFNVYGPGQTGGQYAGVMSVFIEQALASESLTVDGDGEQTRDFVFVDDVVEANLLAAQTEAVGEAYNVGTGSSISIRELAELVRDLGDSGADIVHRDPRPGDIEHSEADISQARETLGYEPTVSISEGLERTIEWVENRT